MDSDSRIPIDKKLLLTIKEAAAYSNIGINRIDAMLREDGCPVAAVWQGISAPCS